MNLVHQSLKKKNAFFKGFFVLKTRMVKTSFQTGKVCVLKVFCVLIYICTQFTALNNYQCKT